ncbi:MAG: ParB/RepB/Spo0J family partition protein [Planctomycetes bacterium]|nr:ParB/RepB/Spo0J family partition protein [Planctomycetota bacterium]
MIPTSKIRPNPYNPNRMTKSKFLEYVAEAIHLGRLPKPLIVRQVDDYFEIIDGEHGWDVAVEVGFEAVLCEVIEADDFEAMRQCYKRNRGGDDNRVLLGRMFQRMMANKKKSIRGLAKEIGVSEGTIRNMLEYLKGAELRKHCAPETADTDIARLSLQQAQMYLSLGDEICDRWLDAGADLYVFDGFNWCRDQVVSELYMAELDKFLGSMDELRPSLELLVPLCVWWNDHSQIKCLKPYLAPVAELKFPAWILDLLPCGQDKGQLIVLVSPSEWASILQNVAKRNANASGLVGLVQAGVRLALRNAGHDLDDIVGPAIAEKLLVVQEGPEFIRNADFLAFEEQYQLTTIGGRVPEEDSLAAKAAICECLRAARTDLATNNKRRLSSQMPPEVSLVDLFIEQLSRIEQAKLQQAEAELFADRATLEQQLVAKLLLTADIRDGLVAGRNFAKCLATRLHRLENPELALIGSYVLTDGNDETAVCRWLKQVLISQQKRKTQPNRPA